METESVIETDQSSGVVCVACGEYIMYSNELHKLWHKCKGWVK